MGVHSNEIEFLSLPIICLNTAKEITVGDLIKQNNVAIDLWTTKCTRCPAALDKMNNEAATSSSKNKTSLLQQSTNTNGGLSSSSPIQFVSICMGDKIDAARQILQEPDTPRWNNMEHYFMDYQTKEKAKELLKFKTVPYYVVSNEGHLVHTGTQLDLANLPGHTCTSTITTVSAATTSTNMQPTTTADDLLKDVVFDFDSLDLLNEKPITVSKSTDSTTPSMKINATRSSSPDRVFEIDDMDF